MKTSKVYTTPKLCSRGGDIAKSWYVYFYYTDHQGTKKQFRYKLGLNSLKTKRERELEAAGIISALLTKLEDGWNPSTNVNEEQSPDITVSDAFDKILDLKKAYITARSYKTYYDQTNLFKKWLKAKRYDHLFTQNFTSFHLRQYFDYLLSEKKYCGKTYNGHLTALRTFFSCCVERGFMKASPVIGFKCVRQETGKNTVYSYEEERKLEALMKRDNYSFFLATRFVRYCFLRRSELSRVQVKHINWDNKTLIIPSENSKSRMQDSVTIPKSLEKMIIFSGILNNDPDAYVFGKGFTPSLTKLNRVDDFSDAQRAYNKECGVKPECTFYSWKHTGAVELYNLTKDPYVVMRQCRHSDIKMTMIYLRSLGCGVNEHVRAW